MATINQQKLARSSTLSPGASTVFRWSPGNWDSPLHFWVQPVPVRASGQHGSNLAAMQVTKMVTAYKTDNYNGDERYVDLTVKNTGNIATEFDVYMSWIT